MESSNETSRNQLQCHAIMQLDDSQLAWALCSLVFAAELQAHILSCPKCRPRVESLGLLPVGGLVYAAPTDSSDQKSLASWRRPVLRHAAAVPVEVA
jgi:hypothetical protein